MGDTGMDTSLRIECQKGKLSAQVKDVVYYQTRFLAVLEELPWEALQKTCCILAVTFLLLPILFLLLWFLFWSKKKKKKPSGEKIIKITFYGKEINPGSLSLSIFVSNTIFSQDNKNVSHGPFVVDAAY